MRIDSFQARTSLSSCHGTHAFFYVSYGSCFDPSKPLPCTIPWEHKSQTHLAKSKSGARFGRCNGNRSVVLPFLSERIHQASKPRHLGCLSYHFWMFLEYVSFQRHENFVFGLESFVVLDNHVQDRYDLYSYTCRFRFIRR